MADTGRYVLGYGEAEQRRLQRQAAQMADDSSWLFDQLEPLDGARVLEIGCGPRGCLDQLSRRSRPDGRAPSLRRILIDLIEEYARHVGHADLIRESVDGLVGEDPPRGR